MRDRLVELKEKSSINSSQDDQDDKEEDMSPRRGSIVVYMDRRNTVTAVEDSFMVDFFQEVEETREKIENVEKHTDEIRKLHSNILSSPQTEPSIQLELEDRMASVKSISTAVRKTLQRMMAIIEDQEVTQRWGTKTSNTSDMWTEAEFRIRRTQHAMLSMQFMEALNNYASIRMEYREKHKEWLRTQMRIVGHEPTDNELEDIMEKGEANIFTDNVLSKTLEARQALADAGARHEELIRIEKSIRELRDMFLEMAILVESQGDKIDSIQFHIGQTTQHAAKAKKTIHQAKRLKASVRKKKIIIVVILTLAAIVLALIIYFTVAPVQSSSSKKE